jgi:1-deoxy-D-xylulose-5-phosphate reductoisomerase
LPKRIAILGSTGSIGCNALEVIANLGAGYRAVGLSAHSRPAAVALTQEHAKAEVVQEMRALGALVYEGPGGMEQLVARPDVDLVLAAVVGAAGLPAVLAAVRAGKTLALANKESLVVAGSLLVPEARRRGVRILPVDSEHSAIFQAMHCGRLTEVRRVILTASGGPFRNAPVEVMENATLDDALKHPTWRMGNKVTIDSATMFNKALELIEACWLFDLPPEKVEVVIHPESVVHSMVEFVDGSVIAQLSPPDMRTPIQYALTYPERREGIARRLNIAEPFKLHFEPPDPARFPALRLAYDVARMGGTAGAVLNAANEAAVAAFSAGEVPFGEISRLVELTIDRHRVRLEQNPSLSDLLEADRWAREMVRNSIGERPPLPKPLARK